MLTRYPTLAIFLACLATAQQQQQQPPPQQAVYTDPGKAGPELDIVHYYNGKLDSSRRKLSLGGIHKKGI